MEREGWKNGREGNAGQSSDLFVSVVQKSFSSFGKTSCFFSSSFFPRFSLHVSTSLPLRASLPSSPFISLHVLPLSPSLRPPLHPSDPVATRPSMASALCFPPPVVFRLCSPRMHLFKSCFTKTVLKDNQRVITMTAMAQVENGATGLFLCFWMAFISTSGWRFT